MFFGGDRCLQSARILTTDQDPSFQLSVVVLAAVFDTAAMFASRDIHTLPFRLHITGIQSRLLLRACTSLSALTVPAAWTNTGSVPAGPKQVWVFRNCLRLAPLVCKGWPAMNASCSCHDFHAFANFCLT